MSGGRVELGIGAGWFEGEHRAYGIPFPPPGERFARLEEQLQIITGLWTTPSGTPFSFKGRLYEVDQSPGLPKPVQRPRPPIIIGGSGTRRTPDLTARFADEFNVAFQSVETSAERFSRVREACETAGRDPTSMIMSNALTVCCADDPATLRRRASAIGRNPDELRQSGLYGTTAEVLARLEAYAAVGSQRAYLQVLDLHDLDHIRELGTGVLARLPGRSSGSVHGTATSR